MGDDRGFLGFGLAESGIEKKIFSEDRDDRNFLITKN